MLQKLEHILNIKDRQIKVLEQKIDLLNTELLVSKSEKEKFEGEIKTFTSRIQDLEKKCQEFDLKSDSHSKVNIDLENRTKIYEDYVLFSSSQTSYLIENIKSLEIEMNEYLNEIKGLARENKNLLQEKNKWIDRDGVCQKKEKSYQEAFQTIIKEFSTLTDNYGSSIKRLGIDVERYRLENIRLQESEKRIKDELSEYKTSTAKLNDENKLHIKSLYDTLSYVETEKLSLNQEIMKLKNLLENKENLLSEFKINSLQLEQVSQNEINLIKNENYELKQKVLELKLESDRVSAELEKYRQHDEELNAHILKIEKENLSNPNDQNMYNFYIEEKVKRENIERKLEKAKLQLMQDIPIITDKLAEFNRITEESENLKKKLEISNKELLKIFDEKKNLEFELSDLKDKQSSVPDNSFSQKQLTQLLLKYDKLQQILIKNLGNVIVSEEDENYSQDNELYFSVQDLHNKYEKLLQEHRQVKQKLKSYETLSLQNQQFRGINNPQPAQTTSSLNLKKINAPNEAPNQETFKTIQELKKQNALLLSEIERKNKQLSEFEQKAKSSLQSQLTFNSSKIVSETEYSQLIKERDNFKKLLDQQGKHNTTTDNNYDYQKKLAKYEADNTVLKNKNGLYEKKIEDLSKKLEQQDKHKMIEEHSSSDLTNLREMNLKLNVKLENQELIVKKYEERIKTFKDQFNKIQHETKEAIQNLTNKLLISSNLKQDRVSSTQELISLKAAVYQLSDQLSFCDSRLSHELKDSKESTKKIDELVLQILEKVETLQKTYSNQELQLQSELNNFNKDYQDEMVSVSKKVEKFILSQEAVSAEKKKAEEDIQSSFINEKNELNEKIEGLRLNLEYQIETNKKLENELSDAKRRLNSSEIVLLEKSKQIESVFDSLNQLKQKLEKLEAENSKLQERLKNYGDSSVDIKNSILNEEKNQLIEFLKNKAKNLGDENNNLIIEYNVLKDTLTKSNKSKEDEITKLQQELQVLRQNKDIPNVPKSQELKKILEEKEILSQRVLEYENLLREKEAKLKALDEEIRKEPVHLDSKEEVDSNADSSEDGLSVVNQILKLTEKVKVVIQGVPHDPAK